MRVGSVCSGIGAPEWAWTLLGWHFAWQAEIEEFPSAVLVARFPGVPNLGDMTTIAARVLAGEVEAPDVLVGGTPCQSFSIAGLRGGLSDDRGNLALEFIRLADAIDAVRRAAGKPPAWILWENVPGVLSDAGNAFGAFLGGMGGGDASLVPRGRWTNSGVVHGPRRCAAWRILDAQYIGLAQRRERVFVLARGGAGAWAAADALLPVTPSLHWHPAPRRAAPEDVAAGTLRRSDGGSDVDHARAKHLIPDVATTLRARDGAKGCDSDCTDTLIAATLEATAGRSRGAGTPIGMIAFGGNNTAGPIDRAASLLAQPGSGYKGDFDTETFIVAQAYRTAGDGAAYAEGDCTAPLTTGTDRSAQLIAFDTTQITSKANRSNPKPGAPCHPLAARAHAPAVATQMAVRRLTPRECERLQGFPDDFTLIQYRGKPAADGPRYRALGNSMAVPVLRWIGQRIQEVG